MKLQILGTLIFMASFQIVHQASALDNARPCAILAETMHQTPEVYTVRNGDTLYHIARLFGMTVERLKSINHLHSENIQSGQKLLIENKNEIALPVHRITQIGMYGAIKKYHILRRGETLQSVAQKYGISVHNLLTWNNLRSPQTVRTGYKIYLQNVSRKGTWDYLDAEFRYHKPHKGIVRESGMGTLIASTYSPVKLALHHSLPIGTFVRVYNEGTGKSVTVKIIGKLPKIDANKDVIIKLSKAAGDALGVVNRRFPVLLAYEK